MLVERGVFKKLLILDNGRKLVVFNVSRMDGTRYTCRAKNIAGSSEKVFDLSVLVPPSIEVSGLVFDIKMTENHTEVLR